MCRFVKPWVDLENHGKFKTMCRFVKPWVDLENHGKFKINK
jgi:hypothetical protein